jgi:hypothetical protein
MECACADWKENIEKVNAPIALQVARSGGRYGHYTGKRFIYCPWCAKPLGPVCELGPRESLTLCELPTVKSSVYSPTDSEDVKDGR